MAAFCWFVQFLLDTVCQWVRLDCMKWSDLMRYIRLKWLWTPKWIVSQIFVSGTFLFAFIQFHPFNFSVFVLRVMVFFFNFKPTFFVALKREKLWKINGWINSNVLAFTLIAIISLATIKIMSRQEEERKKSI